MKVVTSLNGKSMQFSLRLLRKDERGFFFIVLFYVAYLIFPFFAEYSHLPIWLVSAAVSAILLTKYRTCHQHTYFKYFLVYILVLFVYCLAKHPFHINGVSLSANLFWKLLIEGSWLLPNLIICNVLLFYNNRTLYRILATYVILIFSISLLSILPMLLSNSYILRQNVRDMASGIEGISGLPSYTLMSCYSFFFPVICYAIKISKTLAYKLLFICFAVLLAYVIQKTEITTSFVAVMITIILTVSYHKNNISTSVLTFFLVCVIVAISITTGVMLQFVDFFANVYSGTAAEVKFDAFHEQLTGGENEQTAVREYCHALSLNCFEKNIIIGSPGVGEHSSLLDRLGSMGLLGFIPYSLMLIYNVKEWLSRMQEMTQRFFYLVSMVIILIFLYMKGLFSGEGVLFMTVLIPTCVVGLGRKQLHR